MVNVEKYAQCGEVGSEHDALFSVIIPILRGLLFSLKRDMVEQVGGYDKITLEMLTRLYTEGDGDCGICFEYAVHDAILSGHPDVMDRIDTALKKYCHIKHGDPTSILFGAEKTGAIQLIDSVMENLTDESRLLTGNVGKPIKLKKHIQGVVNAFRKPSERGKLPNSINGLWKADLFVGRAEPDQWVGTTVKIKQNALERANGLRLAIVPAGFAKKDTITVDEVKNLIICPMPYDGSFAEVFYEGWRIVKAFFNTKAKMPGEDILPNGLERIVCKELVSRSRFPVADVLSAFEVFKQPNLIETSKSDVTIRSDETPALQTLIAPSSFNQTP